MGGGAGQNLISCVPKNCVYNSNTHTHRGFAFRCDTILHKPKQRLREQRVLILQTNYFERTACVTATLYIYLYQVSSPKYVV